MNSLLNIYSAPLQGYTDHIWRNNHAKYFGGITRYYTPFIRLEKGTIRNHDIKDINPDVNTSTVVPQIIACQPQEATILIDAIKNLGYTSIDINLGCPHPPVALKHKGSGMLKYPDEFAKFLQAIAQYRDIEFSVKMRLGWDDNKQWQEIVPLLDIINPTHITIHPRIGTQKYKGDLDLSQFEAILASCHYPILYNGNIESIADAITIKEKYPNLAGVMIGRGLVAHPYITSTDATNQTVQNFHDSLMEAYCNSYTGGEGQIVTKMKSLWELFLPEADHKARKAIKKSHTLQQYATAAHDAINSVTIG
ncbi:MAG: tRNA-dihydrouridine synthase family protein [Bacteroidales bacterium]|nr:tRNA-dihydrouridine synthase family protein [Candidatus Sodaliphilus fimicaballi]